MKIRFLKTDPRAGMVAALDSRRAHQLVANGSAEFVDERRVAPVAPVAEKPAETPKAGGKKGGKNGKAHASDA